MVNGNEQIEMRYTGSGGFSPTGWRDISYTSILTEKVRMNQVAKGEIELRIKPRPEENRYLKALRDGKRVQYQGTQTNWHYISSEAQLLALLGGGATFRILTTREVPLTYDDVMPGMVVRHKGHVIKKVILEVWSNRIMLPMTRHPNTPHHENFFLEYQELADDWLRWNGTDWIDCTKTEGVEE